MVFFNGESTCKWMLQVKAAEGDGIKIPFMILFNVGPIERKHKVQTI